MVLLHIVALTFKEGLTEERIKEHFEKEVRLWFWVSFFRFIAVFRPTVLRRYTAVEKKGHTQSEWMEIRSRKRMF